MNNETDLDTQFTEAIVCPYCGHEHDSLDFEIDGFIQGNYNCDKCTKEFKFIADYTTTWCTERLDLN